MSTELIDVFSCLQQVLLPLLQVCEGAADGGGREILCYRVGSSWYVEFLLMLCEWGRRGRITRRMRAGTEDRRKGGRCSFLEHLVQGRSPI
jgi:hypothetical protein